MLLVLLCLRKIKNILTFQSVNIPLFHLKKLLLLENYCPTVKVGTVPIELAWIYSFSLHQLKCSALLNQGDVKQQEK